MSDRPGNWPLLNHPKDPVGADAARVSELITYYTTMADTIRTEAATLQQIGDGDDSQFKGQSADALRKRSREVAHSLNQASGRYAAVGEALRVYKPELEQAMEESKQALADAETAEQARSAAGGLPDPSANRPADAPPLTTEETADVAKRTAAIDGAADAAAAARRRLESALSALNDAGQRAKNVITAAWKDGLTDTRAYKIREGFLNFLKGLVKVLMWVGIALAGIGLLIPGLGIVSLLGLIATGLSFVASTVLAAVGRGSWLDVILGAVSLLLIGAGMVIAKVVQNTHIDLLTKAGQKTTTEVTSNAAHVKSVATQKTQILADVFDGKLTVQQGFAKIAELEKGLKNHAVTIAQQKDEILANLVDGNVAAALDKIANLEKNLIDDIMAPLNSAFKVKPQFWNVFQPGYIAGDVAKIKDVAHGIWKWDRLLSVDRVRKYKELQGAALVNHDVISKIQPWWHYGNGGRVVAGGIMNIHKIGAAVPGPYKDLVDGTKADLTTPRLA